tara:strand:+ start:60 stop:323 length:264 start_codon:yes stop_codon:yes gene_type:complete
MKKVKHTRNQLTSKALLFGVKKTKANVFDSIKNKEELNEKINKQVVAYLNSGGTIQKCPAFAYSKSEIETLGPTHKRTISRLNKSYD